jgi:TPP-dependent pyruvate/acetoin dehydrogenase alpha subunit
MRRIAMNDADLFRALYRIRCFEETVLENFPKGVFFGTTHTCLGQEADAVGVISCLHADDIVFSNHRGHGHFLAYGGDPRALFAELMGKSTGVCAGWGGSQHLHWRNFYSNGVQGGIVPVATGMALAEKLKGNPIVTVAFLGDGTLGEGVIYESFNLASLWDAPILYVVENNHIAQTTPIEKAVSGSISGRFQAFGIPVKELDTSDVREIQASAGELIQDVRMLQQPRALILNTWRFGPHSKGDDTRPEELIAQLRLARDPVEIQAARIPFDLRQMITSEVHAEIQPAFQQAYQDPLPVFLAGKSL